MTDDEAIEIATRITSEIAAGSPSAVEVNLAGLDERELRSVYCHLVPMLTQAVKRMQGGDDSPSTARLVAAAWDLSDEDTLGRAGRAAAHAERVNERRAATAAAIRPAPDIGHRMTGRAIFDVPLPDDALPDGANFIATRIEAPEPLMAYYVEHLRSQGWTLDLRYSQPLTRFEPFEMPPHCWFQRSDLVGRSLSIIIGASTDHPGVSRIAISIEDD